MCQPFCVECPQVYLFLFKLEFLLSVLELLLQMRVSVSSQSRLRFWWFRKTPHEKVVVCIVTIWDIQMVLNKGGQIWLIWYPAHEQHMPWKFCISSLKVWLSSSSRQMLYCSSCFSCLIAAISSFSSSSVALENCRRHSCVSCNHFTTTWIQI